MVVRDEDARGSGDTLADELLALSAAALINGRAAHDRTRARARACLALVAVLAHVAACGVGPAASLHERTPAASTTQPSSVARAIRPTPTAHDVERFIAALPPVGTDVARCEAVGGEQCHALAFVGREDRVAAAALHARVAPPCRALVREGATVDALDEIVRRSRDAQVVMINEAHDAPDDRAFTAQVAGALRPLGFDVFAAETFSQTVGRDSPPYPRSSDGYYVNEPAYGDLVRRTRALGFAFVPYEEESASSPAPNQTPAEKWARINAREEAQAANLVSRILSLDPHARVLIHVGYGHLEETTQPVSGAPEWHPMGSRLKEKTGIDPLTIDQVATFGRVGDRRVVCAAMADGGPLWNDKAVDITIMPPALAFQRGRPNWRYALGQRAVDVPEDVRRPNERVVFEARRADEPSDAVPVDRLLVDPGEDLPLLLMPGEYFVRACPAAGTCGPEQRVSVP